MFNLSEYLSCSMEQVASMSLKLSLESGKERDFIRQAVVFQRKASEKRRLSEEAGEHIPLFLIASIASECNLFCAGCYARANHECRSLRADCAGDQEMLPMAGNRNAGGSAFSGSSEHDHPFSGSSGHDHPLSDLPASRWAEIFREAADIGIGVIILAGGEPLTRPDVLKAAAGVQELIFPVFTNGTMIGDKEISFFYENRHVIPVISIEGTQKETDERRGAGVYDLVRGKIDELHKKHILFGASVTVTSSNIDLVTSSPFIRDLQKAGCRLLFFIEYTPVDRKTASLTLDDAQRARLSEIISRLRKTETEMIFSSFPGDEAETQGCLAAGRGFFHISPTGCAEPCPVSPFSDMNVRDSSLRDIIQSPFFKSLREDGFLSSEHEGGCLLIEKEKEVREKLEAAEKLKKNVKTAAETDF